MKIYVLGKDGYQESNISPTFPGNIGGRKSTPQFADLDIVRMIPELVEQAFNQGTRRMLKSLREKLSQSES